MFPARLAHYFIQRFSQVGDLVVDPFSGRGTVALQSRVEGRRSITNDLNPLAYVLSRAKAEPPSWTSAMQAVQELEERFAAAPMSCGTPPDDIKMLYHPFTMKQIEHVRAHLRRFPLTELGPSDLMIAGALVGIMHGSYRRDGSSRYLSISMPNTFSMSPSYVEKYIADKGLIAPEQDLFDLLREKLARLYLDSVNGPDGVVYNDDAATFLSSGNCIPDSSVDLIVTSPPYLQVVNYGTSNWIRLWLLGVDGVGRGRGEGRRSLDAALDHRHTYTSYLTFMARVLRSIERTLRPHGVAAVVIGDVAHPGEKAIPLAANLWHDLSESTSLRLVGLIEDYLPVQNKVSRIWGDTKGQATSRDCILVLAHQDAVVPDIVGPVSWEEPYRDGGPDAAHRRIRLLRKTV